MAPFTKQSAMLQKVIVDHIHLVTICWFPFPLESTRYLNFHNSYDRNGGLLL